ncbi:protein kinase [Actinocorallia sp. B10E7]|uniref:serine/threonine protein kinase n=1 Tax=Actinocorallia sp. B10E7 TaxID=3153558 RepID=UPI00325E197F
MEIPRQIGPYRPLEHLGSGGMGEVYLARAPDGTLLAVKTIRADLITRPDLRVRLRREAEALSRVRGEHLAELVGYDLDTEPPYLATRYVQGRSLRDVVTGDGPLPPAALWRLADGLARALTTVHRAGYLHRDLKPANVMVVDGSPVVIDFGISHALDDTRLSRHGRASGTPAYMAPELVASGRAEPAGDVYSWAATVAYAATGRDAHWSGLGPADLARILFSAETLSPELRDVLDPAFAPDPRDRPAADELVERLASLAPVTGADLHLDHPHDPAATTVTLTLPGSRRVTLDLPADVGAGTTLRFPGQGRLGRNGGAPGTLHLHLVSPKALPPVATESVPGRLEARRSRRIFLLIPVLFLVVATVLMVQVGSMTGETSKSPDRIISSPGSVSSILYVELPSGCRLLEAVGPEKIEEGTGIPAASVMPAPVYKEHNDVKSCEVAMRGRSLHLVLNLIRSATRERASERAMSIFQSLLQKEKKNPYSKLIAEDVDLGDGAFFYEKTEIDNQVAMGWKVLMGNVIVSAELFLELDSYRKSDEQAILRERFEKLVTEIITAFPNQAVVMAPAP